MGARSIASIERSARGCACSRRARSALGAAIFVAVLVTASTTTLAAGGVGSPGSDGVGDSYFPLYGNGGYDVGHYNLNIRYSPGSDRLVGDATITAQATMDLSRFNLDFVGLQIDSLTVDGVDATWTREQQHELVVTPPQALLQNSTFVVRVTYAGVPKRFTDLVSGGVVRTDDGALFIGEPEAAAAWFPVNDHPRDKATYRIDLTVPEPLKAISNGRFLGRAPAGAGRTTWSWQVTDPMASYLATAAIGRFRIDRRVTDSGIRVLDALDPRAPNEARLALLKEERIVRFLSRQFGPYPFDDVGGIVEYHRLGYALETQTRPVYDSSFFPGVNTFIVTHELAHQWFGDVVSIDDWQHIWLNEGFATYAEWLWADRRGLATPQAISSFYCRYVPASDRFWKVPPGDPGVERLFDRAVYVRGAMTLQALRKAVGSASFFDILRTWVVDQRNGTGNTDQFIQLAESVSGMQLDALFDEYLFTPAKPACGGAARSSGIASAIDQLVAESHLRR
ncbi:MAG: M1 family metallopeptidase [Actinomycetota bacterium]